MNFKFTAPVKPATRSGLHVVLDANSCFDCLPILNIHWKRIVEVATKKNTLKSEE